MLKAISCGLIGVLLASSAFAADYTTPCGALPPRWAREEPSVPFSVKRLPDAKLQLACGSPSHHIRACVSQPATGKRWSILISTAYSKTDTACLLMYEKAHMPPNNWVDMQHEHQLYGAQVVPLQPWERDAPAVSN